MRLLVDTTPLRVSRDFRRLGIGRAVSVFGTTVTTAALPFQVFEQTGSSLAVGLLGAAELGPLLVCAVVAAASPTASTSAACCSASLRCRCCARRRWPSTRA